MDGASNAQILFARLAQGAWAPIDIALVDLRARLRPHCFISASQLAAVAR
jgi:hypothetical protein